MRFVEPSFYNASEGGVGKEISSRLIALEDIQLVAVRSLFFPRRKFRFNPIHF